MRTMDRREFARLVAAAVGGIVAGGTLAFPLAGTAFADDEPPAAKHACRGLNECKGQGACKTDLNACKGQNECRALGGCATVKHECKGQNACKGLGGCRAGDNQCAGRNSCKGKGGCSAPRPAVRRAKGRKEPEPRDRHACKGMNACKGLGGCKSGDNGCAGKNSCKGKGGCAVPHK